MPSDKLKKPEQGITLQVQMHICPHPMHIWADREKGNPLTSRIRSLPPISVAATTFPRRPAAAGKRTGIWLFLRLPACPATGPGGLVTDAGRTWQPTAAGDAANRHSTAPPPAQRQLLLRLLVSIVPCCLHINSSKGYSSSHQFFSVA